MEDNALAPAVSAFVWMVCSVFCGCFSEVLLRCERLPFASQSVWLKLVQHNADMSQTQCD